MDFSKTLKEFFASILEQLGLAWWLEVITKQPQCTYYFGPFASVKEAKFFQSGYIEDLEQEEAKGITVVSKRCQPKELTIFENE